jgi:uncharacterized membrane protein
VTGVLGLPRRVVAGRPRFAIAILVSLAAWAGLRGLPPQTRLILAWDAGALCFLVLIGALFASEHQSRMRHDAARQQEGEWTIFFLTIMGIAVSLVAIVGEFSDSKDLPAEAKGLHVGLVAATLFLSWLATQTVFALRYAHEFYSAADERAKVDGGLEFPGEPDPDYLDFMYFALVLGMTFQVSDVQITSRKLRRLAALHGLLGFVFNTIIIALTVNIASGLL